MIYVNAKRISLNPFWILITLFFYSYYYYFSSESNKELYNEALRFYKEVLINISVLHLKAYDQEN